MFEFRTLRAAVLLLGIISIAACQGEADDGQGAPPEQVDAGPDGGAAEDLGGADVDPGADANAGADAAQPECQPETAAEDCVPPTLCEQSAGCVQGRCTFEPLACGPEQVCRDGACVGVTVGRGHFHFATCDLLPAPDAVPGHGGGFSGGLGMAPPGTTPDSVRTPAGSTWTLTGGFATVSNPTDDSEAAPEGAAQP